MVRRPAARLVLSCYGLDAYEDAAPPRIASEMRILVANTPLMYRQTLAMAIYRHAPDFEVLIADPASLDGEVERFRPHALIRDDDGIEEGSPEGVMCWVGVIIENHFQARISIGGEVSEVHEVSLEELLATLDETAGLLSGKYAR